MRCNNEHPPKEEKHKEERYKVEPKNVSKPRPKYRETEWQITATLDTRIPQIWGYSSGAILGPTVLRTE